jgi:two-component system OmpR family sensor kinase/two-component system sensor histidine kinase QseC
MTSIRARLLASLLGLLALAALLMGAVTYRNVLAETETLFDYQLQQMALSLRDQGEISAAQADSIADAQLDFVIQIWTVDGRSIYASRPHSSLPAGRCSAWRRSRSRAAPGAPTASPPASA